LSGTRDCSFWESFSLGGWPRSAKNRFIAAISRIGSPEFLANRKNAWVAAAIFVTLLFGFAHFKQGPTGVMENIIDGAVLAALYFATNRNLLAPIIAHGVEDTIDVLLIYLGRYPGF
jgi:hypothetical protein